MEKLFEGLSVALSNDDVSLLKERIAAEKSEWQKAAQNEVKRMSARTLAPATGLIFAFFYSSLFYCVLIFSDAIKKKREEDHELPKPQKKSQSWQADSLP